MQLPSNVDRHLDVKMRGFRIIADRPFRILEIELLLRDHGRRCHWAFLKGRFGHIDRRAGLAFANSDRLTSSDQSSVRSMLHFTRRRLLKGARFDHELPHPSLRCQSPAP